MSSASQNGTPTGRPSRTRGNQEVAETYRGLVGTKKCTILGALILCTQIKFSSTFGSTNNRQVATSPNPQIPALPHVARAAIRANPQIAQAGGKFLHSAQVTANRANCACGKLPQVPQVPPSTTKLPKLPQTAQFALAANYRKSRNSRLR